MTQTGLARFWLRAAPLKFDDASLVVLARRALICDKIFTDDENKNHVSVIPATQIYMRQGISK
jgi:hypothetical protein